jgi:hypothetical protein
MITFRPKVDLSIVNLLTKDLTWASLGLNADFCYENLTTYDIYIKKLNYMA